MLSVSIFTDGSSRGNPGPGGWGSIVFYDSQVKELGGYSANTTNNRMELKAVIESLRFLQSKLPEASEIKVFSDSSYVLDGIQKWVRSWIRRSWKTSQGADVKNKDLWIELHELAEAFNKIHWQHVAGHAGIAGNERCDEIATKFADREEVALYSGPEKAYSISKDFKAPAKNQKPYYLSLIEGQIYRDKDWKTCEGRVKGRSGVKYKKVKSAQEEEEVLQKWGFRS